MSTDVMALIDRLESEHVQMRGALDALGSAIDQDDDVALRGALATGAEVLGRGLDVHSQDEDEDLFPRIASMIGEGMVSAFVEEHVRIRALRDQVYEVMRRGEADFNGCVELRELLTDHMQREDQALFPSARSVLAD